MAHAGGILYAIGAEGTSLIKIGYTTGSIEKRVKTLQTGQPFPLRVIATVPVAQDVRHIETWLHAFLKQERRLGEWFEVALEPDDFTALVARAIAFGAAQEARRRAEQELAQRRKAAQVAVSPVAQALAHRLRRRRMALGLSLTDLSEQTEIPLQVLSRLEHGRQSLYIERLADLARFLGVSTDYLLGLSEKDGISG